MKKVTKRLSILAIASAFSTPVSVLATNGMNMEGYGPEATGMGGASMAYDNGTAAVMNNPATLGMMDDNKTRVDIAIGSLAPSITTTIPAASSSSDSSADQFYMPAGGFASKSGPIAYGFGLFAQGGMGTEYAADSPLAAKSGKRVKAEVGVGRILAPITYDVNNSLILGATIDYVWADMDLMMAMSGDQMAAIQSGATGSMGGTMAAALGGAMQAGVLQAAPNGMASAVNWARFDFQNGDPLRGAAHSDGFGFKLGMVLKMDSKLSLGATYHSETNLDDMTGAATVTMNANIDNNYLNKTWVPGVSGSAAGAYTAVPIALTGKILIKNFQWPSVLGVGAAFQMSDSVMLAADFKRLMWSDVMDSFKMSFVADDDVSNGSYAGTVLDVSLDQKWKDQNVFQLGATFTLSPALALRAGYNYAENPIPDQYMNPLFPAIIEHHLTGGLGYKLNKDQAIDFSVTYAPEVSATNPGDGTDNIPAVTTTHSQTNWQLMYSVGF